METTEVEVTEESLNAGKKRDVPDEETTLESDVISPLKKQATTTDETAEEKKDESEKVERLEGEEVETKPVPSEDSVKTLDESAGNSNVDAVSVGQ